MDELIQIRQVLEEVAHSPSVMTRLLTRWACQRIPLITVTKLTAASTASNCSWNPTDSHHCCKPNMGSRLSTNRNAANSQKKGI